MHLKGYGVTQNFSLAYYWALSSKLYGETKSKLIINESRYKISKEEKADLDNKLKENLEKIALEGAINSFIPLAKWYMTVPKKADYNNTYKWLSIATAFNLNNAKEARDKISSLLDEKDLIDIQEEAKESYNNIKNNISAKKIGWRVKWNIQLNGLLMEKLIFRLKAKKKLKILLKINLNY